MSKRLLVGELRDRKGGGVVVVDFVFEEFLNGIPVGIFAFAVWGATAAFEYQLRAQTFDKVQCAGGMLCFLLVIVSPGIAALWTWTNSRGWKLFGNIGLVIATVVGRFLLP